MADAIRRPRSRRLTFWLVLVAAIAALNYSVRFSGGTDRRATGDAALYSYSTFAGGMLLYAVWLGLVLLICVDRFDLLALRPPQSWRRAARLAVAAIVAVWICEYVASLIPLPQSPGDEQGLANVHWEPAHAGAFAANAILLVGIAFGLSHGLLEALIVLVPFGIALAWLRDRTESVVPGMFVHALFNGAALAAVVLLN